MFKEVLQDVRTVLELDTTLLGNVSIWDYSIYDTPRPVCIILRPGPLTRQLDTFQDVWQELFLVYAEVSAAFGASETPREVSESLLDYLDLVRIQLSSHSQLQKPSAYIWARLNGFTYPATLQRHNPDTTWFSSLATIEVNMVYEGDDLDA